MKLELKLLYPEAQLPTQAYPGSVGWDLSAYCLDLNGKANTISLMPGQTKRIRTGLQFGGFTTGAYAPLEEGGAGPVGGSAPVPFFAMICSRSGMAQKSLFVANAPGIIDPDYRGEIEVLLFNGLPGPQYIRHGDRIAQLVCAQAHSFSLSTTERVSETVRGEKGFGSSGK